MPIADVRTSMLRSRWGVVVLVLLAGLAIAFAPWGYVATGGVLLPAHGTLLVDGSEVSVNAHRGSRMLRVEYASADPRHAVSVVNDFLRRQKDPLLLDEARVVRAGPGLTGTLALGALLLFALALAMLPRRRASAARSEKALNQALGVPMLAARPLAVQPLCGQLLAHWFRGGRAVLAVVSPDCGAGRSRVTAELARAFARMGEPTLLIDADLRSPRLHREFGVPNRAGLADFLEGRESRLAHCAENLAVMVAGRSGADPLDLLSRSRLPHLLAAAAKRYRVVLIDTPAAARGPDLQMFAAFGGGALVVARFSTPVPALERLRDLLGTCRARVVGTVLNPA